MSGRGTDFFISHAGRDTAWAEWLAWQLQQAGYTVELDVWDWAPGEDFVARMQQALEAVRVDTRYVSRTYRRPDSADRNWKATAVIDAPATRRLAVAVPHQGDLGGESPPLASLGVGMD